MLHSGNIVIDQVLMPFILLMFIVAGVAGIALGVGLAVSSARTLRFLANLNRWVSLRNSLKPLEEPRDIDKSVYRHRRFFGVAFTVCGAFVVYMLLARVEFGSLTATLSRGNSPVVVDLLVESLRWFLIIGGALAVVIGAMLLSSTLALPALESRVNRWYSARKLGKGADEMHLSLDDWAAAHPRAAGGLLVFGSAIELLGVTIVWLGK